MKDMTTEQLEARAAEIDAMDTAELAADVAEKLAEERDAIHAEMERRKDEAAAAEEKRSEIAKDTKLKAEKPVVEERTDKPMTLAEIRASVDYSKAYLRALKGDETEARSLLSGNAIGGQIPVPTMLENEIKTAWEEHQLMSLVKHSYYPGNVKVGFELTATGAVVHAEGTAAPEEEVITIGAVELKAQNIKKWITVSDEAIEGTTIDTIGYLYKEIAHKIVEKAEEVMIGIICDAPDTSSSTACAVLDFQATNIEIDTMVKAVSLLSAQAKNLHVAMNRQTYPYFVSVALKNHYGADPFDGLKDRIVFTDKLPPFTAADGEPFAIVGDFGYGFQANFPNGNEIVLKLDDLSLAERDLVKIVGRQYVGMNVVAPNCFVRIKTGGDPA